MKQYSNCLILYEIELDYLHFHFSEISKYFSKTICLNYNAHFVEKGIASLQDKIEEVVNNEAIDIVFIFHFEDNYELSPQFYNNLRNRCRLVFWLFDDEMLLHAYSKHYVQTADAVITTDYLGRGFYESIGIPTIFYVPSYSRKEYLPNHSEKIYDVSFVGDVGDSKISRWNYIKFLQENGIRVSVFGPGSGSGFVSFEEMIDVFNKSRINLNFTAVSMLSGIFRYDPLLIARSKQYKGRPIEIALTRSFCLSEYAPALSYVFNIGEEIDTFRNNAELLSKIRYYLENEEEREQMAEKAFHRAISQYESEVNIRNVMNELFAKLAESEEYRIADLEIYESNFFRQRRLFFYVRSIRRALKKFRFSIITELLSHLKSHNYSMIRIIFTFFLEIFRIKTIGSLR